MSGQLPSPIPDPPDRSPTLGEPLYRIVRSEEILLGANEVLIRHGSEIYRLRITRSGKLILTK